jgi:hypothetical protein
VEDLRAFMKELVDRTSLRHAAALTDLGHEAIRKFVEGNTEHPHPRSIKAFTLLYWRERGLVFVSEAGGPEAPVFWASELRGVFPGGRAQALADVRKVFELAERFPEELPGTAGEIRGWMLRVIDAEYRNEMPYRRPRRQGARGRAGPKGGAGKPKG